MATESYYSKDRANQAAKHTIIFRAISAVCAVVSSVLLVRLLSEEQYGVYNLLYALLPLTISVLSFGLNNSLSRYIPEFVKDGEFRLAKRMSNFAQLLRFTTSIAVMVCLIVFWSHWSAWFNIAEYRNEFYVFSLILIFILQYRLLSTILSSYLLQKYSIGARAGIAGSQAIAYATVMWIGGDLMQVLYMELAIYFVTAIVLLYLQSTRIDHDLGRRKIIGKETRGRITKYAAFYNFNDVGTFVMGNRFDNFFLAAMLGPAAVGAYAMATTLSSLANKIGPIGFLETIIKPVFFSMDRNSQAGEVTQYFQLMIKFSLIFGIPIAAYLISFHSSIVMVVLGGKFNEFSYLIAVVNCFSLISRFGVVVSFVAQLAEKAAIVMISKIFILYNIVAIFLLVPALGVLGAAIATGSALFLKELFIWWHVRKLASLDGMAHFFMKSVVLWVSFLAISLVLQSFIAVPLAQLLIGSLLFIIYMIAFLRFALLTASEKEFLTSVLPIRILTGLSRIGLV